MVINETRESNMRHKVLTRRHIRDSRGQFTGRYRLGIDIIGMGYIEYPKSYCAMQLCILVLTYLAMS